MNSIDKFLESLKSICDPNFIKLNKPVKEKDFQNLQKKLGLEILPDFKELYSKFNGEHFQSIGIIGNWKFLEIKHVIREWELMLSILKKEEVNNQTKLKSDFIKNNWWDQAWIPIVSSGSGHLICIDMDPAKKGKKGQVILFLHDEEKRYLIANSISDWLGAISEDLQKGKYKITGKKFSNPAFLGSSMEGKKLFK
ncbi:MAG: SMI1/KNR4 family protein [Leptospiraceae bacterium]|nr:SMI1/KNR4 family protein [Leptospiraceae bacterium]